LHFWGLLKDLKINIAGQVFLNLVAIQIIVFICIDLVKSLVGQFFDPDKVVTLKDFLKVTLNLLVVVLMESGVLNLLAEGV